MADTRLNIQLKAENSQMNSALKASNEEIQNVTNSLEENTKSVRRSLKEYLVYNKVLQELVKSVTGASSTFLKLNTGMAAGVFTAIEYSNAIGITAAAFADLKRDLDSIGPKLAEAKAGMEGYIHALESDAFVQAAEHYQIYETRLTGITGSVEEARKELVHLYEVSAGKEGGGFSSDSINNAALSIKELGQSINDTLPLAIKLAAGTGTELERSANALGDAFSGLETGFSQLQRTFNITRTEIKLAGAALDENGDIASRTAEEYEKTRAAIEKIINTKYGDVLEQQSKSLKGAFQTAKNALTEISEEIGLISAEPIAKFVSSIALLIDKARIIVPILKYVSDGLYGFLVPIELGARFMVKFADAALFAAEKVKVAWDWFPQWGKDTAVVLTTMAATGLKTAAALSTLVMSGLGLAAVAGAVGLLASGLGVLAARLTMLGPASAVASAGLGIVGRSMFAVAAFSKGLALSIVANFAKISLGIGAVIGILMVYNNHMKEIKETQQAYGDQVYKTVVVTKEYTESLLDSIEAGKASEQSSKQIALGIKGVQARAEGARLAYQEYLDKLAEKRDWLGSSVGPDKEEQARLDELRKNADQADRLMIQVNAKARKMMQERRAIEEAGGDTGDKLLEKSMATEKRNLKFQEDKAKGLIQTAKQEADEIDAIYEESVKNKKKLEDEVGALEADFKLNPGNEELEKRLTTTKQALEREKQIENGYRLERLAKRRESVQESLRLQQEELNQQIELGRAGKTEQLAMLKNFLSENANLEQTNIELYRAVTRQIISLAYEQSRERKQAALDTRAAERALIEDKLNDLKYEDSIGKNRTDNLKEETRLIHENYKSQIDAVKAKRDLDLEAQGDANLRAEITKQAEAEIKTLLHQEKDAILANKDAHAEMTAAEIQDNQNRINSQKELLQSRLDALQNKFDKGYDNQAEIQANKQAQLQKEIDVIRSEEKAKLAVEKNATRIATIKLEAANKIKIAQDKFTLESAAFEESVQVRLAERKIKLNEITIQELETRQLEFQSKVRDGQYSGLDVYDKEEEFIKRNTELKIASIRLQKDAELANNQSPQEQIRIRRQAANEEKKVRLEGAKSVKEMRTKEMAAAANFAEKELQEQKDLYNQKVEQGQAGLNLAFQEREMIFSQLKARKDAIEAHAEEAKASGDVKDHARIQRDAQIQINQAIRDSVKVLGDVNLKYQSGNTELDKITKKYDHALRVLQQMEAILEDAEQEPMPEPPTEEEMKNNPMAKSNWQDKIKEQKRKAEKLRKEKEKIEQKKKRDEAMQAEDAIEAKTQKDRYEDLKAEGMSTDEARAKVAEEASARRRAKREAEKNKGKVDPTTGLDPNKTGKPGVDPNATPATTTTPTPGQPTGPVQTAPNQTDAAMLSAVQTIVSILQRATGAPAASTAAKNNGQGASADVNKKDFTGKPIADFSLGDKMNMQPYSWNNGSA